MVLSLVQTRSFLSAAQWSCCQRWVVRCLTVEPTTRSAQNDKQNQRVLLSSPPAAILGITAQVPLDPAVSPQQYQLRHILGGAFPIRFDSACCQAAFFCGQQETDARYVMRAPLAYRLFQQLLSATWRVSFRFFDVHFEEKVKFCSETATIEKKRLRVRWRWFQSFFPLDPAGSLHSYHFHRCVSASHMEVSLVVVSVLFCWAWDSRSLFILLSCQSCNMLEESSLKYKMIIVSVWDTRRNCKK